MLSFKKVKISNSVKNGDITDTCNIASIQNDINAIKR